MISEMQHFIINFSICLFSLWLVYKLLLENTSWHTFKRFYLLGSLLVSGVIPFLVVRTVMIPSVTNSLVPAPAMETAAATGTIEGLETVAVHTDFVMNWDDVLLAVYLTGVLIMGIRFGRNLYRLRIKTTDQLDRYESYTLVLRTFVEVPHSFFNRIYASITDYKKGAIPDSVLQHEKAHLDQKHSWDILLLELLIVAMWFNPLLYLIKYSIKLNHEFLADQVVLANGVATKTYQETLLAYAANSQKRVLANTFNFPTIKKRFTIMKTNTTTASGLLRSLAIVPVLALLVISCGKEVTKMEPVINHNLEILGDDPNSKYGLIVDGYKPVGTVEYANQNFKYVINEDHSIDLYTIDDRLVDLEKNRLSVHADYDAVKEVRLLIENGSSTRQRIGNKQLRILDGKLDLNFQDLLEKDFTGRTMAKYTFDNNVEVFDIFPNYNLTQKEPKNSATSKNEPDKTQTTNGLNKSKDSTSSFYVEVANEPDSEDFYYRKSILTASFNQNKELTYQINGKKSTVTAIQEYLVKNEAANMTYTEGAQNTLNFSDNTGKKMTIKEIQDLAMAMAQNGPKENTTTFVAINEATWKVVTVDATVNKGTFERKGAQYTYDSSDLNQIKVFDKQGKLLNEKEYKNLAVGFHVVWWKGEQKYKELLKQPEIIEGFKNGTYAVFYRVGNKSNYTKDYEEVLKLDATNTFLWMGSTLESTTINIDPHSWANTNPSYKQFQKYLTD